MSQDTAERHDALTRRVKESLKRADKHAARLKRMNTRLLVLGVVNSGASTLITGVTAAQGPVIGEGIPGWRLACAAGAVFGFATTISVGLSQRLDLSERLSKAHQCLGRLRFLDIAIDTGSRTWGEITDEYEAIVKAYPDIMA
jgi:hypothetical protein